MSDAAAKITPPATVPLKDPKNFTIIGKRLKRFDTPNKTDGKVVNGIDAMLPGMKFATIAASPVLGGKVGHVDDSKAKLVPGVEKIVVLDDMVAVVGQHMWAAKKGLDALVITQGTKRPQWPSDRLERNLGRSCAAEKQDEPAPSRNPAATSRKA